MLMSLRLLRQMAPWRTGRGPVRVDPTRTWFRVAPSDLDVLMHMNNGRYLSVLDAGRVDMFVRGGLWRALRGRGWHPVVASQTITYVRSLTLGTKFSVSTRFLGVDAKNAYLEQIFDVDGRVHATAIVALRFLDDAGSSVPTDDIVALFDGDAAPLRRPDAEIPLGRRTQHLVVAAFEDA
ncbi:MULTISPECIES: thioesterase family protein [Nocardiaceae]|uniref:Acyl-CoA thioesterase FadM n=1 Tax=Rhodococcoides corynebacterioides TaxID=53972 RepID=A0ABS2KY61_9NOCA|nr:MULTISPECIES: acyl-CoA thioesterase [Rhodococcus]MBM7416869.1 acyl-CoA thioesterase FadM [Rhodococcus corynebacterioides]MBP1115122.1 acyl-CoA thioesterase FadM [Rhodococcus sp. PvP016]